MTRSERKKQSRKKLDQIIWDINQKFTQEFKRTKDMRIATKLTEGFIHEKMRTNPTESHIWERAALEWQERFVDLIRKEKER